MVWLGRAALKAALDRTSIKIVICMSRREIGALKTAINVKFNLDFWFDERRGGALSSPAAHNRLLVYAPAMSGKTKGMMHQHNFSHNHPLRKHVIYAHRCSFSTFEIYVKSSLL
jgi:hypothetical protein